MKTERSIFDFTSTDPSEEFERPFEHEEIEKTLIEKSYAEQVSTVFPELSESGAEGAAVAEALILVLEKKKVTIEDLENLISGGIRIMEKDQELPSRYKLGEEADPHLYIAAADEEGRLFVFPAFFDGKNTPEKQARILAHELGHLMDERPVVRGEEGDTKREPLVSAQEYFAKFGDRPRGWHGKYTEIFLEKFPNDAPHEMLAEDMADYLRADSAEEWVALRLERMNDASRMVLFPLVEAGAWDDPELAPFLAHAQEIIDYFDQAITSKKRYEEPLSRDDSDDLWSSYYSGGGGAGSSTYNSNVDLNLLANFYDRIFGVK